MSNTYNTIGLVLKRRDYQENDRLFCLLTKDYGKIDVIAKGTKKISSKLNSYMEPFYLVKLMIAKGKVIDKLANVNLIKSYSNLRNDNQLLGFYLINYLTEVIDGLIEGKTLTTDKFDLLIEILDILDKKINDISKDQLLMITNVGLLKLLSLMGYQVEIHRCLNCHKGLLLTNNIFDFSQGGIICEDCKKVCLIEDYIKVSDGVIKILHLAQEKELTDFVSLESNHDDLEQFNQVVYKLILINIEKPIKTLELINKLP
jgi:DNA repair protein RecO (recombination protein O)